MNKAEQQTKLMERRRKNGNGKIIEQADKPYSKLHSFIIYSKKEHFAKAQVCHALLKTQEKKRKISDRNGNNK